MRSIDMDVILTVSYADGTSSSFVFQETTGSWKKRTVDLTQLDSTKTIDSIKLEREGGISGNTSALDNIVIDLVGTTDDTFLGTEDNDVIDDVSTNDIGFGLTTPIYTVVKDVSYGILDLNSDGTFTYTPNTDFVGTDSFTYEVSDGALTDTATVTITVNALNDAPVAQPDKYSTIIRHQLNIDASSGVLQNDTDIEGDTLTAILQQTTNNGELIFNADGSFSYTLDNGFIGTDTFSYYVSDGTVDSAVVNVDIVVETPDRKNLPTDATDRDSVNFNMIGLVISLMIGYTTSTVYRRRNR